MGAKLKVKIGAFETSLKRSNAEIKSERAEDVCADAEMSCRRKVDDLASQLRKDKLKQKAMLDMSPDNADSLLAAKNFDADAWVKKDLDLVLKIRNDELKLEMWEARYEYLFGGK